MLKCAMLGAFTVLKSTLQYLTFQPNPRGQGCVKIQSASLHVCLHFFQFNLICNMTTFIKEKIIYPFDPTSGVLGVCNDSIFAFMVLCAKFTLV